MLFTHDSASANRSYALFDIDASSVGVALAIRGPEGPTLLWHTRLEYAYQGVTDYARYERLF